MKALFPASLMLFAATACAMAQSRPSTTSMSCQSAASLVQRSGAIVLGTGGQTYDRYIASPGLCDSGYYARPAFVPTKDNPQCNIGYYCSGAPLFWR